MMRDTTMKTIWLAAALLLTPVLSASSAFAQSDDDLFGPSDREETVAEERAALESGDLDDRVGVQSEDIVLPEDARSRRRIIKALPRKRFLKIGRWEAAPHIGLFLHQPV